MPKFTARVRMSGYRDVTVEADSREQAYDKIDRMDDDGEIEVPSDMDIEIEWPVEVRE